jgi:hypothetical protein
MKVEGFAERLSALLDERRDVPYAWGTNDCVTWAADVALAVSGADPLGDLRGTWTDEASAMAALEAQGGLIQAMDKRFPRRSMPSLAQRGDLALVRLADGSLSLAAVEVLYVIAPSDEGLLYLPLEHARIVWEV